VRAARITGLLFILAVVILWGIRVHRRHAHRNEWNRPLEIAVILVSTQAAPPLVETAWDHGVERLERWFGDELHRWRPDSQAVLHLRRYGPLRIDHAIALEPAGAGTWEHLQYAWSTSRELKRIDDALHIVERGVDARIYVLLEPAEGGAPRFVEGIAEAGGEVGLVHAGLDDEDIALELTACAHELLHCLGATDKYDAEGHALPQGLVDAERNPRYPQRFAEPMVGEIPVGPRDGKLPSSLDDVRVGAATAREIGWERSR
jgi:hypothetical protein